MPLQFLRLDDSGWEELKEVVQGKSQSRIGHNLINQWKTAGAQFAVIDHEYIDRDFTEMFASFYSRTFKRHGKLCKRAFIFSCDFDNDIVELTEPGQLVEILENKSSKHLISIVTLRPVPEAPINSISSLADFENDNFRTANLVKSNLEKHLIGANVSISALEMTQQDSRVGSCAQASIWTVARHFKNRHGGRWIAIPEITQLATSRAGFDLSQSLPLGSDFLPVGDMVHTLANLGREPYGYSVESLGDGSYGWRSINPTEVINRYLDSGIPLILGINFPNAAVGHAIVASGRVRRKTPLNSPANRRTTAEFYSHVLVNDDQMGPNMFMRCSSVDESGPSGHIYNINISGVSHEINIEQYLQYIIVPLPSKVFFTAEKAENISAALLNDYCSSVAATIKATEEVNDVTKERSRKFVSDTQSGEIIFRTYLTYGWKYKKRALKNELPSSVKVIIRDLELPKYVWVTEIGTFESLSSKDPYARKIFAHSVIDATAKNTADEAALLFHAPGYCLNHQHDRKNELPLLTQTRALLNDEKSYFPKRRGDEGFEKNSGKTEAQAATTPTRPRQ